MKRKLVGTPLSVAASLVGLCMAVLGSHFLFQTPPSEHPSILTIALMLGGGVLYVLSGLLKKVVENE